MFLLAEIVKFLSSQDLKIYEENMLPNLTLKKIYMLRFLHSDLIDFTHDFLFIYLFIIMLL